ncbi:MAG: 3-phosphoserine/phosphohydroxythreonine transaminase [Xanthomonadaceae bacterium]|nr:3-phosphoserine/phosphohydroxythreonine transaminase [Xanthomonadaceae bacterium]MDP2186688.1 3-phosphoserine/phosphohydroxythreonine transaminase [Xanthomonadales bacterium]MDZ4115782.1 3-phosphoserine/phosphohydroxythreonine transaminase [Xanthomonadaceae bacterium]MDZ4378705.1 3-phosphoserine/phosphohydroxythreonine transaminase [Xanthomonadaceae bacterium]
MSRVHNFSAGPAALPEAVLRQAQAELLEWNDQGASVMELSHRGQAFIDMAAEAERDLRELMAIPTEYAVAFLQGGATLIQALLPLNFAASGQAVDYVLTGHWGEKAIDQARPCADVSIAASAEGNGYTKIPARALWRLRDDAAYLHITSNETIHGVEFADTPEASRAPLIADMSSSILSRSLDVSRYGMIYAGAQKNIGPSGIAVAIIHPELLARAGQLRAPILSIGNHLKHDSMLNTPPTFAWYLAGLVFKHLKQLGGVAAIEAINRRKAQRLYAVIDGSNGFYRNRVDPACRSRMNVPFFLANDVLEADFLKHATANGLIGLKGHRVVGGIRASIYNAVTEASVEALAQFMIDFAQRKA